MEHNLALPTGWVPSTYGGLEGLICTAQLLGKGRRQMEASGEGSVMGPAQWQNRLILHPGVLASLVGCICVLAALLTICGLEKH